MRAFPPLFLLAACASLSEEAAFERGVRFLCRAQNSNGSWGSPRRSTGFDVLASPPGSHDAFRYATTALCVRALQDVEMPDARQAWEKGLRFLLDRADVRRANAQEIYNVWAHGYGAEALAAAYRKLRGTGRAAEVAAAWDFHMKRLDAYETAWGGWNYYDFDYRTRSPSMPATSFTSATVVIAMRDGKDAGLPVPEDLLRRALRLIEKCRNPDGSYLYSYDWRFYPQGEPNRIGGSIGRSQACNTALALWNRLPAQKLELGLRQFFDDHGFIEMGRKRQWPHEAWYATAPYYFYFGHYYAARAIRALGLGPDHPYARELRRIVLLRQDPDGSWWDYRFYDYSKPYGTAFGLLILRLLRADKAAAPAGG